MSWLTKVRNSIPFLPKRETPDNLWHKCPECEAMVFTKEYEENLFVCPRCDHHGRIGPTRRFDMLLDPGYTVLPPPQVREDPLKFRDSKRYTDRIKAARAKSSMEEAVLTGTARIGGYPIALAVFEFSFLGGSMASVVGEKITRTIELALQKRIPLLIVAASGGARMQEGILSLMQMAKTSAALQRLAAERVPYISLLTDPTTGGVTASFAMLGDLILAEPRALIGFAGPRVIAETIRQPLPEGFQRSEFLLEHGQVDAVVERRELRPTLRRILAFFGGRDPAPAP